MIVLLCFNHYIDLSIILSTNHFGIAFSAPYIDEKISLRPFGLLGENIPRGTYGNLTAWRINRSVSCLHASPPR